MTQTSSNSSIADRPQQPSSSSSSAAVSSSFETYTTYQHHDDHDEPDESRLLHQHQHDADDEADSILSDRSQKRAARRIYRNFLAMSLLFSANHGAVVACLGLATARLGSTGAWQSGMLYLTYTGSALLGATYLVKRLGSRNALFLGMSLYTCYVAAFWLATALPDHARTAALTGAAIGGLGAGFLWTAQGAFFATSAAAHAAALGGGGPQSTSTSTAKLASVFAFIYLALELILKSLSSILLQVVPTASWSTIFAIYAAVTLVSALLMLLVPQPVDAPNNSSNNNPSAEEEEEQSTSSSSLSVWYKVTAAVQLLRRERKMQYMIGLNAVFGFTSAFLNSYINGEVVALVWHDSTSKYVGWLTAWVSVVAATMSLVFGRITARTGQKGPVLTVGAISFALVALPFVAWPRLDQGPWNHRTASILLVMAVYTLHGIGRATFEGTLKATFADFFPAEKEGAFANIILQNGLASAAGFVMSFSLTCQKENRTYCVAYQDGTLHNVGVFEWLIVVTAVLAIWGYWKAEALQRQQTPSSQDHYRSVWTLIDNR